VRAIWFQLVSKGQQEKASQRLAELVRQSGHHLGTGFLSTRQLLPTLCAGGYSEDAFKVLLQDTPPSRLYPVKQGATTIWETWEGHNKSGDARMSHNHYSLGAVCGWLIDGLVGLTQASPGWQHIRVTPEFGGGITHASAKFNTPFGMLSNSWALDKLSGDISMKLHVPAGTRATVALRDKESFEVGSGSYELVWRAGELKTSKVVNVRD
jgi:alpha-L-rhamnosidase